jgi:hypothetical protein
MKNYRVLIAILVGTLFSTIANIILFNVIGDIVKSSPTNISFRGTWGGYVIFTIVGIVVGLPTGLVISSLVTSLRFSLIFSILAGICLSIFIVFLLLFLTGGGWDESTNASIYPFVIIGGMTGAVVSLINYAFTTEETE